LPASRVTGIAAVTPDEAWIATRGGVAGYLARDGRVEWQVTTMETGELPAPITLAIAVDRRGVVWAATSAGAAAFDRRGPRHAFTSRNAPLLHQILDAVYVDGEGLVWFGGAGGVNVYQPPGPGGDDGRWLVGFTRISSVGGLPDDLVFKINGDSKGRIWFGTAGGAAVLTPDRAAFGLGAHDPSRWQTFTAERAPFASPHVHAIVEDRQGRIWLGTERGILVLDESQPRGSPARWQRFDAEGAPAGGRGLPHPWVQALAVGPDGRVWAGTRGGLAVYDPASAARGWLTYGAHPLRRWTGYLWPAHWQQNILSNEVTALAWSH
jgi:ligand-binding sensor domain-containing protein